jgi:hypothetical protein
MLTSEVAGTSLRLSVSPRRHTTARPRWLLHRCKTPSGNGRGRAKLACRLAAVGSAADHFQGPAGEQEVDRLMAQRATSPRGSLVGYSSKPSLPSQSKIVLRPAQAVQQLLQILGEGANVVPRMQHADNVLPVIGRRRWHNSLAASYVSPGCTRVRQPRETKIVSQ